MYSVILARDTQDDIKEILEYYDSIQSQGGFNFALQLEETIEKLEKNPFIFAKKTGNI